MPAPFTRLLLATEHGEFDCGAEALALVLARQASLPLFAVLPVMSNPEFEVEAPQLAAKADAEAATKREQLQALAQRAGVALHLHVRHGSEPWVEIVAEARTLQADLLVIRRRGKRSLLANLLVGEMVSKVLAHAPCSVLMVPRAARLWSRGVLAGIDPQQPDIATLDRAAAIAGAFALPLHLVCVAGGRHDQAAAQQALDALLARVRTLCPDVRGELRSGRPHEELLAAAKAADCDLVVLGPRSHHNLGRAWIGGVAQRVIGLADGPVLVHLHNPGNPKP